MAIETNELIDVKTLSPFKKFIMTIGALPTSYLASMTYAELVMWFCNYLQETVIPTVNNNAEAVEELQNFVTNYFNNLDVTEEIENKLDKMAEDGTLTNLIAEYIDPIVTIQNQQIASIQNQVNSVASGSPSGVYDTVSDLETADPDHSKIYVVIANGNWYYYDTTDSEWTSGGIYQATEDSGSIDYLMKWTESKIIPKEPVEIINGLLNNETGEYVSTDKSLVTDDFIEIPNHFININVNSGYQVRLWYYAQDETYISYTTSITGLNNKITIPSNVGKIKYIIRHSTTSEVINVNEASNVEIYFDNLLLKDLPEIKNKVTTFFKFNNLVWTDDSYINSNGEKRSDAYSSPYSSCDYLHVISGLKIYCENIAIQANIAIAFYDNNKNFVSAITNQTLINSKEFTVPSNVSFMRLTTQIANKSNAKISYLDLDFENINKYMYDTITKSVDTRPIITWIDDDTDINSIPSVKTLCDSLDIKMTFGCVTKKLTDVSGLTTLLKSYQEDGHQITSHTYSHDRWYTGNLFDTNECITDLVKSLEDLTSNTFFNNDYIIAPGSSFSRLDIDISDICKKYAKALVINNANASYNIGGSPNQYALNRTFINKTLHDTDYYKDMIDYAITNNAWIIFGSHSYNSTEFDTTFMETILQYAIDNNVAILTLDQAYKERELNYSLNILS